MCHKLLQNAIFRILDESVYSSMHSFSKIDFTGYLTVGLTSNMYNWSVSCYYLVWSIGS